MSLYCYKGGDYQGSKITKVSVFTTTCKSHYLSTLVHEGYEVYSGGHDFDRYSHKLYQFLAILN